MNLLHDRICRLLISFFASSASEFQNLKIKVGIFGFSEQDLVIHFNVITFILCSSMFMIFCFSIFTICYILLYCLKFFLNSLYCYWNFSNLHVIMFMRYDLQSCYLHYCYFHCIIFNSILFNIIICQYY